MARDTKPKITTSDIATLAVSYTELEIASRIDTMPSEDVPALLARANPLKKALAFIELTGERRIVADALLGMGEQWVDPETGVIYVFGGAAGENECRDPLALHAALIAAGIPKADADRAIYPVQKVDFRVLKELGKRNTAAQEAIEDYTARKPSGPPHLKEAK